RCARDAGEDARARAAGRASAVELLWRLEWELPPDARRGAAGGLGSAARACRARLSRRAGRLPRGRDGPCAGRAGAGMSRRGILWGGGLLPTPSGSCDIVGAGPTNVRSVVVLPVLHTALRAQCPVPVPVQRDSRLGPRACVGVPAGARSAGIAPVRGRQARA